MTFDQWWVEKHGTPPLPEQVLVFNLALDAWDACRKMNLELVEKLRIQIKGVLVERDEAVSKEQRHLELRRQAETQCGRAQAKREEVLDRLRVLQQSAEVVNASHVDEVTRALDLEKVLRKLSNGVTEFCESEVDAYELICEPNDEAIELLKTAEAGR